MNKNEDEKRLGQAVESLASTIVGTIELKLRRIAEETKFLQPESAARQRLTESEGWAGQKEAAAHLKISRRLDQFASPTSKRQSGPNAKHSNHILIRVQRRIHQHLDVGRDGKVRQQLEAIKKFDGILVFES